MAKTPKIMTEAELKSFTAGWVGNMGDGSTLEDKARILEYTHLTEEQADKVIENIKNYNY